MCSCTAGSGTGNIKARFENLAKQKEEEDRKRAEEERARRQAKELQEQEEARRKVEVRLTGETAFSSSEDTLGVCNTTYVYFIGAC